MVALSRCLGSLAFLLAGAEGARVSRSKVAGTKFIAGVPVLNYDAAYSGSGVLGELESEREQEWVLVVNQGTSQKELKSMCERAANGCNLMGHPSEGGVPFVEVRATEKDLEAMIKGAKNAVQFVEPDTQVYMIPEIHEAEGPSAQAATWGLNKIGQDDAPGEGQGTTVFVMDTGVRNSHRQFEGRAIGHLDMSTGGYNGKKCNGDKNCALDVDGHGTHCAGTVAGKSYGVAPKASIGAIKVLGDSGEGAWSWSYAGLDYIASSSIRPAVASMSLGGAGTNSAMKNAVDGAVSSGVVVVVAAGNDNADACGFSPAFVPSAITVGSTTSSDSRSWFSCYGSCVDIWAPGSDILSADEDSDTGTDVMSGTSMACPHVSGASALALQAYPNAGASGVLSSLLQMAKSNKLSGLKSGDTNKLLFVGEPIAAPGSSPSPPPDCSGWGRRRRSC